MEKVLTIAICAYNMEQYIGQALRSCLIKSLDLIEVLIMNDGSTDRTAEIADSFCKRFPDNFKLMTKENGGWGSNVNLAITIAQGKYFKILDADDWFETKNLQRFVTLLQNIDADLVTTLYTHCLGEKRAIHHMEWEQYVGNRILLNDIDTLVHFSIWGVTFRREMLREHPPELPEHMLYTDTLFIIKLLPHVKYVWFCDYMVYNYRLGRLGQSVSRNSIKKHYPDLIKVLKDEVDFYADYRDCPNNWHMFNRLSTTYVVALEHILKISCDKDIHVKRVLEETEDYVRHKVPEMYEQLGKRKFVRLLRMTKYRSAGFVNLVLKIKHRNEMSQM